ncbi:hypothetical protein [Pseudonocardia acidicola]|uniref:Uncharacterized protein n=1 Tax=Pseudonocardia acidicola TaxID=2724939 RepID=A0ABX1SI62_9PSEU|nr:hypothetical protein [Pseudonocardia acidicola]NMI01275.1 hypothetical protein [Pseudonocardia acidicola]
MIARGVLLVLLVAILFPGAAGVASAHAGGLSSSASEPRVLRIDPPVPRLDVRVVEFGARLCLDNGTALPVVVEPLPGSQLSGLPAVAPGARAYWTDPRITMAAARRLPAGERVGWTIPLRVGDQAVAVRGEQFWPPPPSAAAWWGAALAALIIPAVAGIAGAARRWGRVVLAVATGVVLVAHLVHVLGSAVVPEDRNVVVMVLSAAGYALLGWPLGGFGIALTLRGRPAGPLLCCAAGGLFAIVIAPVDAFTLVDAVVPFAWGGTLDRILVALTLGGGLGVAAAGVALLRRGTVSERPAA